MIEYIEGHVIYENPKPHVRSRHGCFPGLVQLTSGEIVAMFVIQEAFEAANATTWVSRSADLGKTWTLQGPVYDKSTVGYPVSDSMKPALLRDGTLVAVGYRFRRDDPEQSIAIPETGGFQPGEDIVSFSTDDGHTWTEPRIIPRSYPELVEISSRCVELHSGELVTVGALFKLPDGGNPSGRIGVLLRSGDKGQTWDDHTHYFRSPGGNIVPFEGRICEMQPGRLVAMVWAYDDSAGRHLPNQVATSHDGGHTWSQPIDTGHRGQASSLIWLGGDRLATIHAQRGEDPGLYVRVVDFAGDRWRPLEEQVIWGAHLGRQTRTGQATADMFTSLRFGQPSLLNLSNGETLATHWSIEDGQGKIRTHRLRLPL
ncbi:MAG: exo-alpha-sialidase [Acidobacteria bacterium]|nr:exo-alpha-sialidase [Acidobacteriota bacterium]